MDRNEALSQLIDLQMGFLKSGCLYVVTKLEVADLLADGEMTSDEIAARVGADQELLYRVMRLLASDGVFEEKSGRVFALTPMSDLLRTQVEGSFHPMTIINSEWGFEAIIELLAGVQTGQIPFQKRFGKHPFEQLVDAPEKASLMERAWQGIHWPETEAVLHAYDFKGIDTLADIGGGHGDMLVGFLNGNPTRRGVLFDLPAVADQFKRRLNELGLESRCDAASGDFFESIPVKADAYFMRHILHDWNDEECIRLLENIAATAEAGNRVLIAECLIKEPNLPDTGKLFDIEMLLFLSGRERTAEEYGTLLDAAGFELSGITDTNSIVSVVEGRLRA
jgi:hypothetical protein